ncbi:Zinc finger CCHC domain-containing protein 7 [Schistosoma japonicum]|nr:Zinc finger CCHC domain-containing protein 7 [Schistosoma japonicum]KAH8868182.1 Zinc finger CCHC domain-containing protein 7 [Schistosoma japonicum]KAH8868183.1 Zinc finger CCHC domain-containing protein 7 [Schistosoma japonicum]
MDCEASEENNYDSDFIDEDTESRLYSAVFFESSNYTPVSRNLAPEQIDPIINTVSYLCDSESFKSPTSLNVSGTTAVMANTSIPSLRNENNSSEDEYEKGSADHISSSSSSGCSVLLCGDDNSSETVINTKGVILGVSHDTLLHVKNKNNSSRSLSQEALNDDPNLWRICNADRYSSRSASVRYFSALDNSICPECGKKRQKSHRCCICCILCGEEGHEKSECDKLYCFACLAPGHTKYECHLLNNLKKSICERCGQQGHNSTLCTELWRQYRNTTSKGKPIRLYDVVKSKGCCNCGRRGHTVEDCRCRPLKSHFLGPLPRRRVLVYDKKDIYRSIRLKLNKIRRRKNKSKKIMEEVDNNCVIISSESDDTMQKLLKKTNKKRGKLRTVSKSYSKFCKSFNGKKIQKVLEQELPYKASSSPYVGNFKRNTIIQKTIFAQYNIQSSPEVRKTKKKKKRNNTNQRSKLQDAALSHLKYSTSSSYNCNEIPDDFSITQRTRKRRTSRSAEEIQGACTSYSSFQNTYKTPLRKSAKKCFSQSLTS